MAKGNHTRKRLTAVERRKNRRWIHEKLNRGLTLVEVVKLGEAQGIAEETIYKVGRERKEKGRLVNEIIPVTGEPITRVDVETLPKNFDELRKWVHDNYNSPAAIAQLFRDVESMTRSALGIARIQAINLMRELVSEYDIQEGVVEHVNLIPIGEDEE